MPKKSTANDMKRRKPRSANKASAPAEVVPLCQCVFVPNVTVRAQPRRVLTDTYPGERIMETYPREQDYGVKGQRQ